ncbi:SHOCT domain-containing protein [Mycobacterium sp. NPDC050551]|uniref:SHOCT domain-containing protein n=1 Tax=Mycobacterium sp. NPDC050551 TaxID=3155407 RepID=UPI00342A8D41
MTDGSRAQLDQRTAIGAGTSIAAAVAAGVLCARAQIPADITATLVAGAGGLPAAIEYSLRSRRRNTAEDIARLKRGELRRPVWLVTIMLSAALLLSYAAVMLFLPIPALRGLRSIVILSGAESSLLAMPIAWYASHYLGQHPYRWTALACCITVSPFVATLLVPPDIDGLVHFMLPHLGFLLGSTFVGVLVGRYRHAGFVAWKLKRAERSAAQSASKPQALDARTSSSSADLLRQLQTLAELRDAGIVTADEFMAKKAEILARI